ncbi:hypothetical protein FGB62_68g161 [Gracilaria domingensis]|nr:hypothetical protein FGB62_68g161 [Gracilaria domingensis]
MGKRNTIASAVASLGFFALGATLGARRARLRLRRNVSVCASDVLPHAPPTNNETLANSVPLDCPICLTEVILPRVAPCGHTLCTSCLAALFEHERRPACPVCRKKIKTSLDRLPVNFALKSLVEARVAERGDMAWDGYRQAENDARQLVPHVAGENGAQQRAQVVATLRPAWNWFKWSVIIVTEFGAFLVSLKEVLESTPNRTRRYQRIV